MLETKKIIKIRSRTPATASESERSDRGPSRDHQESNEVRVTLLFDERDNIPQTRHQTRSPSSPSDDDSVYGKSTVSPTTARASEALAIDLEVRDFLVDEVRAIPERIFAHKSCARAYQYAPPRRSTTIGQLHPAAVVARNQSRRPKSRGRPQIRGGRTFGEPIRPEPVVARGPGRVDCRGRVPEHSASPRRHSRGRENQGEVRPPSRSWTPSRPVLRFPCIRPVATRGNDGSGALQQPPPEQEDEKISLFKRISPFDASMELKFELDTRLTVSCVVAVASAYGLLSVSIALNSILLAFGNAVILLLILFVLFGWRELLGEFKKRTAN